ncbi:MAG: hypothetical protein MJ002_00580 [Paludibacteraceae bacterium]|nr:hypothetical protein [Paludibacteraceae bacterium]
MRQAIVILSTLLLLAGCSYNKPVQSQGYFTIEGVSHSFSSIRIDHVGYVPESDSSEFILRLTAYPGTFSMDTVKHKGYGTVFRLFFVADDCDLFAGDDSKVLFHDSLSQVVTIAENGDTTAVIPITAASVAVSSSEHDFLRYSFTFTSATGLSSGEYTGKHIANRLVDQPAFGTISFDTVNTALSTCKIYNWEHLFSPEYSYYELIFYSADARFSDDGRLRSGVQFSLGITSPSDLRPLDGDYSVSSNPAEVGVMYGHKLQNASWGTYWNVFYAGSSVGKANILSGTLFGFSLTDDDLSFSFDFIDQLNNPVIGSYDGKSTDIIHLSTNLNP